SKNANRRAVPFPVRRLDALRQRTDGRRAEVAVVNLVQQTLRLRDSEVLQQERRQRRLRSALVRLAEHRPQRRPPDPIAAALVSQDVSPPSGSRSLICPV